MAEEKKKGLSTGAKIGLGCLGAFIFLIVILAIAGSGEEQKQQTTPTKTEITPQTQQPTEEIDFAQVESAIYGLQKEGLIQKIDPSLNKAYVNKSLWDALNVERKEKASELLAYYVGYKKGTDLCWVEIYDFQSGKKLAKYSKSWGFKIY